MRPPTVPLLLLVLAALVPSAPGVARAASGRAFVFATDYSTGSLAVVDLDTREVTCDVAPVHADAALRWHDGLLYVVNRLGQDNVQVIDPAAGYATVRQFSVGNGSNPQDIAVLSRTRACVSRLGSADLLVVNPATGALLDTVSLAAWADADGNPEAAGLALAGPLLLVALQRLTNFQAVDSSAVAVIDTRADTVWDADPVVPGTQVLKLPFRNPVTRLFAAPGPGGATLVFVGCAGTYGLPDGGVVRLVVEQGAGGAAVRAEVAATEAQLGGDVLDLALPPEGPATLGYAIVSDASFNTRLVRWDPDTGELQSTLEAPGGFSLADCALDDRGELFVCNSSFTAPGLRVYRAAADTLLAGPLDTCLPPVQVVFDEGDAPPPPAGAPGVVLTAPAPHPARGEVRMSLVMESAGSAEVEIFDPSGRRVRLLARGDFSAGSSPLAWDLRDDNGTRVRAGVYLVRARSGGAGMSRRVVAIE